jgi:hypothetical protein
MLAAFGGFESIISALITAGADVSAVDNAGSTADWLCSVALTCYRMTLSESLLFTFITSSITFLGCQALHVAVEGGHVGAVIELLQAGAWVDASETKTGWTPLLRGGMNVRFFCDDHELHRYLDC